MERGRGTCVGVGGRESKQGGGGKDIHGKYVYSTLALYTIYTYPCIKSCVHIAN